MRVARFGMLGLGALLAGRAVVGCASDPGEPGFDAGTLPDVGLVADDAGGNEDTGVSLDSDGGSDSSVSSADGGGPSDDGGSETSSSEEADGGDAATAAVDASDAALHETDASDGAANEMDASDGATHEVDASDEAAVDASDGAASVADASDGAASEHDAGDASSSGFDASAACASLGSADPIHGVSASAPYEDGGIDVMTYAFNSSPTGTGAAPAGSTVTFHAWTTPADVMSSMSVMYFLDNDAGAILSFPMTLDDGADDAGAAYQLWTASFAAQSSGTGVTWWVQGTDVCRSGTDYYSNSGSNYFYSTQ